MEFPYTAAVVAGCLIILQQALMMNTGIHRGKASIGVGFGEDKELERKIRRHGNLAENAALFIVVLSLTEGLLGGGLIITAFGALFLFARLCHAAAFSSIAGSHGQEGASKIYPKLRVVGALGTALSGIGLGMYLLISVIMMIN